MIIVRQYEDQKTGLDSQSARTLTFDETFMFIVWFAAKVVDGSIAEFIGQKEVKLNKTFSDGLANKADIQVDDELLKALEFFCQEMNWRWEHVRSMRLNLWLGTKSAVAYALLKKHWFSRDERIIPYTKALFGPEANDELRVRAQLMLVSNVSNAEDIQRGLQADVNAGSLLAAIDSWKQGKHASLSEALP